MHGGSAVMPAGPARSLPVAPLRRGAQAGHAAAPAFPRTVRVFEALLLAVLAGYALFDRGFAWLHVPGTPVFAGELAVTGGLALACVATPSVRLVVGRSAAAKLLLVFAALGAAQTLPQVGTYGLDAVRDAALWYYALIALAVAAFFAGGNDVVRRWSSGYARFLPWLVAWSVPVILLENRDTPVVPGSSIPVFSHKPGNTAVHLAMAIAFLWLVPSVRPRRRYRLALTAVATTVIIALGTQNRGGLVAAAAGLGIALAMVARGHRMRMAAGVAGTLAVLLTAGWVAGFSLPGDHHRDISVAQLVENLSSLGGGGSSSLSDTVQWRDELWSGVVDQTLQKNKLISGWGFGPNLARDLGFQGTADVELRSPHNSHVDVFARMGVGGALVWIALWVSWFVAVGRARSRLAAAGDRLGRGVAGVVLAGVAAILVNAYFDPSLEGPQVALWLWTLVGVGIGLAVRSRTAKPAPAAPVASAAGRSTPARGQAAVAPLSSRRAASLMRAAEGPGSRHDP